MPHATPHTHAHAHGQADAPHRHDADLADLLDLDAVVLHAYWSQAMTLVSAAVPDAPPQRIVDLGAGTGVGTLALADVFPGAEVVAVDVSPESLGRLEAAAARRGLADRVTTRVADLDAGWPDLGPVDLAWSSLALHHLADPVRVLAELRAVTTPGGVLAVAEFEEALRFLPDDLGVGRPGFEARLSQRLAEAHRDLLPMMDAAWPARLTAAGWTVTGEQTLTVDLDPPESPEANRYAWGWFSRLAEQLGDALDDDDRATLAVLVAPDGPHTLLSRTDLHIRGERTVTVARR
ncbi:MAG: class I SAM-dependent methyltransferase [Lapillicoccus sp.]